MKYLILALILCAGCSPNALDSSGKEDVCIEGYRYRPYYSDGQYTVPVPLFKDDKPMRCANETKP